MIYFLSYIRDTIGNNYLGINISESIVKPFLNELRDLIGDSDYEEFTDYQQKRDHGSYHITVINTMDYNRLAKESGISNFVNSLDSVFKYEIDDIRMLGLGTAERNGNRAYFVVCESEKLDAVRTRYNLPKHDFHITLGFRHKDVFGIPKNKLIDKSDKFLKLLSIEFYKNENWNFIRNIENFDLDRNIEIIPISISDTSMKIKCNNYYIDVSFLEDSKKFWITTKYPVDDEKPRLSQTEISKILK